ncbi:hypothetical protein JW992_02305 [candidate division KSB1 bacterium]|nr:hypothetical protein [candidate division KSB1 bacterium]
MNKMVLLMLASLLLSCRTTEIGWETIFEQSDGLRTPRYLETMDYFARLANASPQAKWQRFGVTPLGRDLNILLIDSNARFTPETNHHKPLIFILCAIHPGESAGKDAAMILARELLIENRYPHLVEKVSLGIIPIFNADGHENFNPYNRINQIGPEEMGFRVTSTRLNLNRDFMKADSPEMQHFLELYQTWKPDLLIDCHTTDGEDFQYVASYYIDTHPQFGGPISVWARDRFLPDVLRRCEEKKVYLAPYAGYVDPLRPDLGMQGGVWPPRLSNIYCTLCNRGGFLIEAHSLKNYKTRVRATGEILRACLESVADQPDELLLAVQEGDLQATQIGRDYDPEQLFSLTFSTRKDEWDTLLYRGYRIERQKGKISGLEYLVYSDEKRDRPIVYYNTVRPEQQITPPMAYVIPPQWQDAIAVLQAHRVPLYRLNRSLNDSLQTYRFSDVAFHSWPYEGRFRVNYQALPVIEKIHLPPGSVYVPLANPKSRLILNLLEPQAPDALVHWGFFNTIFEHRVYFETYVMEPMAQQMLAQDPASAEEFKRRCDQDSVFAADGRKKLEFFYERTPYYDRERNRYPIVRLTKVLPNEWLDPF